MTGPLVIPTGVQIRLIWTKGGTDQAVNVLGALNPSAIAINQTLANTIGAAMKAGFTSSGLRAFVPSSYALSKVGLRDINIASQAEWLDTGTAMTGTGVSQQLPDQVSYCVTLRTALAGKRYRGRFYIPAADEAANDALGVPTATYVAAAVAFVNACTAALTTSGLTPAVLSRVLLTGQAITTAVGRRNLWNTQRRRLEPGI
jgi:hypothetical protein